ncbi:hypothetical protein [Metabacillus bambusae]|uniref:Uncharacterized protein n=1 Tax=Metabacillus bambusae TaxID=2795218 RepID=A0ABS3MZU7_9BACI|nr:hypothetical protein [Metabacillus bambusae]MBO1511389.1 hypothetical protein [Metabacillus bambusae]
MVEVNQFNGYQDNTEVAKTTVITTTECINESNVNSMLDSLKDSEIKLRETLIDAFPNIDDDRFIDTLIKIGIILYLKGFDFLMKIEYYSINENDYYY